MLEDRAGGTLNNLDAVSQQFIAAAQKRPEIGRISSNFKASTPGYEYDIDRDKAKVLGVSISDIFSTLQVFLGGNEVNDFTLFGRNYKVAVQADGMFRGDVNALQYLHASAGFSIKLNSDANSLDTIGKIKELLKNAKDKFPTDMDYAITIDNTKFIYESILEVCRTFLEALALVVLVVYLFLQSWRATLIPLLAVPVSLIGTFTAFTFLGFTINTLTLFAMLPAAVVIFAHRKNTSVNMYPKIQEVKLMFEYAFIQNAFIVAVLISVVCPLIGMFLVLRRYSMTLEVK